MTCTTCGAANEAGRKFCGECGTRLAVTCPTCGSANAPSARFCGECGEALGDGTAAAPAGGTRPGPIPASPGVTPGDGAAGILVQLRRLAERTPPSSTSRAAQAAPSTPAAEAEQAT